MEVLAAPSVSHCCLRSADRQRQEGGGMALSVKASLGDAAVAFRHPPSRPPPAPPCPPLLSAHATSVSRRHAAASSRTAPCCPASATPSTSVFGGAATRWADGRRGRSLRHRGRLAATVEGRTSSRRVDGVLVTETPATALSDDSQVPPRALINLALPSDSSEANGRPALEDRDTDGVALVTEEPTATVRVAGRDSESDWESTSEEALARSGEAGVRPVGEEENGALSRSSEWEEGEAPWWVSATEGLGLSPRWRGLFLLNILTLFYASNISVIKEAEELLDPALFTAGRFLVAALVFSPWLKRAWEQPAARQAGMELGLWAVLGYLTQAIGITTTEAGRASFISTFTVIVVPLLAGLFGATIPVVTWFSAAAAVVGVSLLETSSSSSAIGDVWTFISAVIFGVHMLRTEHYSKSIHRDRVPGSKDIAVPLISLQLATMAGVSILWALGDQLLTSRGAGAGSLTQLLSAGDAGALLTAAEGVPWIAMVYTGLLSTALCLWIEIVSMRDVTATEAAMVYTLEPLYGAAFAWVLLSERWGVRGWFGGLLILGGSLTMQLFGKTDEEQPLVAGEGQLSLDSASKAEGNGATKVVVSKVIQREEDKNKA